MKALVKMVWIFIIGSFLGCLVEEVWCFLKNKCFKIRKSLVHAPLIPIYGMAACFIIIFGSYVNYETGKMFILGAIIATIVEYISSYFQEKIFKTKSWDYSQMPFNIHGRVNLLYSIGFGLITIIFTGFLCNISIAIDQINNETWFTILTLFMFMYFIYDVTITTLAAKRQKDRREGTPATKILDDYLDIRYSDARLNKIYNNSVYIEK